MMRIAMIGVYALAIILASVGAMAFDVAQIPTKNLHVTWLEPTVNHDGTPLTDLAKIVLQLTINGVALPEEEAGVSGMNGGQVGFHTFLNVCEPDTLPSAEVAVWAVDTAGNRSVGTIGLLTIDCLAPGPVQ